MPRTRNRQATHAGSWYDGSGKFQVGHPSCTTLEAFTMHGGSTEIPYDLAGESLSRAIDQWLEDADTPEAAPLRAIIGP